METKQAEQHRPSDLSSVGALRVGVSILPPLVTEHDNTFGGFEIELWEKIASRLHLDFTYKQFEFKELLAAVEKNAVDVGIAGITKTKEREIAVDFSHDTLESSLSILVSRKNSSIVHGFRTFVKENFKKILLGALALMVFVFSLSFVLWLVERSNNPAPDGESFFEALYTIVSAVTNSGFSSELIIDSFWGKSLALVSMVTGLFLFGVFAAGLASILTTAKIKYLINAPRDLAGKKVATKEHTFAEEEIQKNGATVISVKSIDEACALLQNYRADAVVFDTPVILHYLKRAEDKNLAVASTFLPQVYGFAFPEDSNVKEYINRELLGMQDSGEYQLLCNKYFAATSV